MPRAVSRGREELQRAVDALALVWATRAPAVPAAEVVAALLDGFVDHSGAEADRTERSVEAARALLEALRRG